MIKVDYSKMEVTGDWKAKFQDIKVMEKVVFNYVKLIAKEVDKNSRPFIYKSISYKFIRM